VGLRVRLYSAATGAPTPTRARTVNEQTAGQVQPVSDREMRIAENETRFRTANEDLLHRWADLDVDQLQETLFICECGDRRCTEIMRLTLPEYEAVRSDPNTFAVVRGHDDTATEKLVTAAVVAKNERFAVVEKRPEYREVTEGTDPR
jgi:hypothetical protein